MEHQRKTFITIDDWCTALIRHAKGELNSELPALPPDDIQKITNNMSGEATVQAAESFYRILSEEVHLGPDTHVLDFGCGWGRISRFLLRTVRQENISGIDVDEQLISAAVDSMPSGNFFRIEPGDPLPYSDDSFDVIFSNSVFSHLSEPAHRHYMRELARCLKPSALLLATFLNGGHLKRWFKHSGAKWLSKIIGPETQALEIFEKRNFIYGHSHRIADYGLAFASENWIITNLPNQLTVDKFRYDYVHVIMVARK